MRKYFTFKVGALLLGSLFSCYVFASDIIKMGAKHTSETFVKDGKTLSKLGKAVGNVVGTPSGNGLLKRAATAQLKFSEETDEQDILVDEDFSKITDGTPDKPGNDMLAYYYGDPGMYMDTQYTKDGQWGGSFVYPAGGMVALISPNEYTAADLNTPLGDYSGDITLTFKAKATENSDLMVNLAKDGYTATGYTYNEQGDINTRSFRIYKKEGWKKYTVRFRNTSANPDGFVQFHSYGSILLDDVQITTSSQEFVAAPELLAETNIGNTSFTANWNSTRKAFNYVVNLYKKVYTSESDTLITENFESVNEDGSNLPAGWTFQLHSDKKVQNVGADDSKGLFLQNNDTITTPYTFSKLKEMKMWLRIYDPKPYDLSDMDNINWDAFDATIHIQALTLNEWKDVATITYGESTSAGVEANLTKSLGTSKYYGLRFYVTGLPEGDHVALDNISITMGRPGTLAPADFKTESDETAQEDRTSNTHYTFSGLDPEGDYYYTVNAHYLTKYSDGDMRHLVAVGTPALKEATDITGDSYTANWEKVGKATGYEIYNYGVNTVTSRQNVTLIDEDFSKIDESISSETNPNNPSYVGNNEEMTIDDFTKLPGWTVLRGAYINGMFGVQGSSAAKYYLATPQLYLGNSKKFNIHIKAYGAPGEGFIINVGGHESGAYFEATDQTGKTGIIDKTFEMDCSEYPQGKIYFYTLNHGYFLLDAVSISQSLKSGDKTYTYLSTGNVDDNNTTSFTFNGLHGYERYAYAVKSLMDADGDQAESALSPFQLVKLNGSTAGINSITDVANFGSGNVHEVGRYSVDGKCINRTVKGINIVKMSDGSVRKVFVK